MSAATVDPALGSVPRPVLAAGAVAGPPPPSASMPPPRRAPAFAIRAAHGEAGASALRLGLGEPTWFQAPGTLPAAARRALAEVTAAPYGSHAGERRTRHAVAAYAGVDPERVLITAGAQGALFAIASAYLGEGDVALVPDPGFPAYGALARMAGATVRPYSLRGPDFSLDPAEIRRNLEAEPRARVLFVNHPANPTGGGASAAALAEVATLCQRHGVQLVSDEVYRELYVEERPASLLEVSETGLVVGSISKGWGAPGLRVGWAIGDPEALEACRGWHAWAVTSAAGPSQAAAAALLEAGDEVLEGSRRELRRRWRALRGAWRSQLGDNYPVPAPAGGFYWWFPVPSSDFCGRLAERAGVSVVPGEAFGSSGAGWARLSFGAPVADVAEGARRVAAMLAREAPRLEAGGGS